MKTILYPVKQRGQERGLKTRENADANGGKQRPATLWRGAVKGKERPLSDQQRPPCERYQHANHDGRSEEHTSELQSLMRISYAVFCLKKKKNNNTTKEDTRHNRQKDKQR